MEEGAGKKGCGAVVAAAIAALGIGIARGADDCAMTACRTGSHAEVGVASSADDALRLGRLGPAGSSSDDIAALGLAATGDGLHARGAAGEIAEAAAEEVVYEVVAWSVSEEDDGDDMAGWPRSGRGPREGGRQASAIFGAFASECAGRVVVQSEAVRRLMELRRSSPAGREIVISRVQLGRIGRATPGGEPQIVVSRQQ